MLAGGRSQRMGTPKGLVEINGISLFEHQIRRFDQFGGKHIVIVLGHIQDEYHAKLNELIEKYNNIEIKIVNNPNPDRGQFSSIQEGVKHTNNFLDGVFILPIDTPLPDQNVFEAMMKSQNNQIDVITPSYAGKGGHPIWISYNIVEKIILSTDDNRLDHLIHSLPEDKILKVNLEYSNLVLNLNTPSDLITFQNQM